MGLYLLQLSNIIRVGFLIEVVNEGTVDGQNGVFATFPQSDILNSLLYLLV